MNNHTPGPWEVDVYGDVTANGEDVARIATTGDCAEHDAHLIAAAPDQHDALCSAPILSKYHTSTGFDLEGFVRDYENWSEKKRAAIAKATGQP